MTLRLKTLGILTVTVVCLLGILLMAAHVFLMRGFATLEEHDVREKAELVLHALDAELTRLERLLDDPATLLDADPETPQPFTMAAIVPRNGAPHVHLLNNDPIHGPFCRYVLDSLDALSMRARNQRISGLLAANGAVGLVALRDPTPASPPDAPSGTVAVVQVVTPALIERLQTRTDLPVTLVNIDLADVSYDFSQTATFGADRVPVTMTPRDDAVVQGRAYLPDLFGLTRIALEIDVPRTMVRQGRVTVATFTIILAGSCLAFGLVMLILLEEQVLKRVTRLSKAVATVGRSADLRARIPDDGTDEMAQLGTTINTMLEQLETAEQQLVQAEKMASLGVLVAGVAHEINNPNQFIMTHLSPLRNAWTSARPILDRYYEQNGEFRFGGSRYSTRRDQIPEMFDNVAAGAQRIKSIVQELRDYARHTPADERTPVHLNDVAQSAQALLGNMLRKSTRRFRTEYAPNLPPILGNYQRLEQVIINLLQNACQALETPEQAVCLATGCTPDAAYVWLEVRDEGRGIPQELLGRITDPFFTTRRADGGTGLGLSIAMRIVEQHNGRLTFTSDEQHGTSARLTLPAAPENTTPDSDLKQED